MTAALEHPALSKGDVVKVDFQVSKNVNRLHNKVRGKGKKGGQMLEAMSPLCKITCSTGDKYIFYRFTFHFLIKVVFMQFQIEHMPSYPKIFVSYMLYLPQGASIRLMLFSLVP